MARIRSIKPEFWDDRKLARSVSRDGRMLYMGLWNQADEHARLNGDVVWLKGRVFPYDDDITVAALAVLLSELEQAGRIVRYEVDGDPYIFVVKLANHQRLEPDKVPSRLPDPPPITQSEPDTGDSERRADQLAPGADELEQDAESSTLLYVAGSREHDTVKSELKPSEIRAAFADFWSIYPRKVGKAEAERKFGIACRRSSPDVIIAAAHRFAADVKTKGTDPQYVAHPSTWLHQGRWEDEATPAARPHSAGGGW